MFSIEKSPNFMNLETSVEKQDIPESERPKLDIINENSIDSKMKAITNEMETLKEKEIKRLIEFHLELNMDKDSMKTISKIFECLFGEKESLNIISNYLNEQKEMKRGQTNINKNSRSMSDSNIFKNTLIFTSEKTHRRKEIKKDIFLQFNTKTIFTDYKDVNFKYNFLYNKTPSLQNQFPDSTFLKFNFKTQEDA